MKFSIITDEFTQDLDAAIALARRYGLDALELRTVEDLGPFELPELGARRMAGQIRDAGLTVSALSSPFFKCDMDDDVQVTGHLEGLAHCIRLADIFDTQFIRGFTFWRKENGLPLDGIIRRFQEPLTMLDDTGITVVLESDPSVNACNASELAAVIEAIDSPRVAALWDPGNSLFAPVPERPFPEGYGIIRPYLRHVHLKDAVIGPGGQAEACRLTTGQAGITQLLDALREDGYTGYLALEPHYRINNELSEETLKLPGGAAFSAGGYQSTCESLDSLWALLGRSPAAPERMKI